MKLYQRINDILVGGGSWNLREAATAVWQALHKAQVEIPSEKYKESRREVKFLGTRWIEVNTAIPPDTLSEIEDLQMPQSRKEIQQITTVNGNYRILEETHTSIFFVIACLL